MNKPYMITPPHFSDCVKTLFRRKGSRPSRSRVKILSAIDRHNDGDFSNVDIYKSLQEKNEAVSISTIDKNLKNLNTMGLLVSNKTKLAVTLYRKSASFKKWVAESSLKLNLLPCQFLVLDNYLFAYFVH